MPSFFATQPALRAAPNKTVKPLCGSATINMFGPFNSGETI
jgi:hypothetical protein